MEANGMLKDKRSGKIAIVAHCILNQNSRVLGLVERSGAITEIAEFLLHNEMGIIQMPCPELTYAGLLRKAQTRDQYDTAMFRRHCKRIVKEIVNQFQQYEKSGIKIRIVIGVDGSPSCGVNETSRGESLQKHVKTWKSERFRGSYRGTVYRIENEKFFNTLLRHTL